MADIIEQIESAVKKNKVMIFMKGNRSFPQCGFSAATVAIFDQLGVPYETADVLSDPELRDGIKRYNKTRGLVIIGVSCDLLQGEGLRAVAPFVEKFQINYPVALADEALVDSLGVEAIPTTLFVGPDGKIISRIVGAGRPGEISEGARLLIEGSKNHAAPRHPSESGGHVENISVTH